MTNANRAFSLNRRIGSTNYTVTVFTSDTATENYQEKVLRLVRNDVLDFPENRGIIALPQTGRQSERSA